MLKKKLNGLAKSLLHTHKKSPKEQNKELHASLLSKDAKSCVSDIGFAIKHALYITKGNAIFTYIPKNACSSMRYSIAISEGFISEPKQVGWIHRNNWTLMAQDIGRLLNPAYSFVILRCPFTRLVSVFLDKFIKEPRYVKEFVGSFPLKKRHKNISFKDFVFRLYDLRNERENFNRHWRPQVDFLLYQQYDRYFSLERSGEITQVLQQDIGFDFQDARPFMRHHTGHIRTLTDLKEPYNLAIEHLRDRTISGAMLPSTKCMYNKELYRKACCIYKDDIDFYSAKFGTTGLLFNGS